MSSLDPLAPVTVERIEVLRVPMEMARPLRTAAATARRRDVLLVHVRAVEAEGWAECAAPPEPTYAADFTDATVLALRDHLIPRALAGPTGDAVALGPAIDSVRGHHMARAAVELAVLDAQLRAAGRSLASWLGATATSVGAGAALGLHDRVDGLLKEADEALAAGAVRLRVKVAPGRAAEPMRALRDHVGSEVLLQADANGSFREADPELARLDGLDLACLEQPLEPDDLLGHARLAARLDTPICLDEPLTSLGAIEAAIELGACEVVCLKPARVGGWIAARRVHDRCAELGVPLFVGGMLETGIGRAANLAVAALPHVSLPPDLDPRGRFRPDLADPRLPVDGAVVVPDGPGTGGVPEGDALVAAEVVGSWSR
jgi:O-succinylbenzoate synthase